MSRCNYCDYVSLKSWADKRGLVVTKASDPFHIWSGGVTVYAHPPEVDIKRLKPEDAEQYVKAWFAELPRSCAC